MKLLVDKWLLRKDILLSKFRFMSCEKFNVVAKQNDNNNNINARSVIILGKGLAWLMCLFVCVVREMRSKHFLSSTLGLTWQVSRFSLVGGLFGCMKEEEQEKKKKKVTLWCLCSAPQWKLFRDDIAEMERNDVILMQKAFCVARAYCCND